MQTSQMMGVRNGESLIMFFYSWTAEKLHHHFEDSPLNGSPGARYLRCHYHHMTPKAIVDETTKEAPKHPCDRGTLRSPLQSEEVHN